jgi:MoaA/NifB/PqqE/SkfB family radical SAM enzyme
MTGELAEYLYKHNASVMGKLDSLKPEVQDYIAGREGAFRDIKNGLENLIKAGFSKPAEPGKLRLGISFVSNKMNLEEIEDIWHFCRQNNIFPIWKSLRQQAGQMTNLKISCLRQKR